MSAAMRLTGPLGQVQRLGAAAIGFIRAVVEVVALLYGALASPFFLRTRGLRVMVEMTLRQTYFTGVQGLPLVSLAGLAIGTLIITEANTYLPAEYAATTAAHILTKDVLPIVIAVIIIGRSGTAICVELAGMKLAGQLEALQSMGMPLEHVIVLPRLVGGVASTMALGVYGLAMAAAGGYALSKAFAALPFTLQAVADAVTKDDLTVAGVKTLLFAVGIVLVCVREGYSVQASAREVPQATTRAVVRSMGLCLVLNSAISIFA
jgi:phospholipid/cholesterol/gamma-HCH transport system permease protein